MPELEDREMEMSVPLYHGTSTLFLEDILKLGLGGKDPLRELRLFDFIGEIHPLVEKYLTETEVYRAGSTSWGFMVRQFAGGLNYQHGQTYLSASRVTAGNYAVRKPYGSELLTYSLDFLRELVRLKVPTVRDQIFKRYPKIFRIMDTCPAPIMVEARHVPIASLLDEKGSDPSVVARRISDVFVSHPHDYERWLQQQNFRLVSPVPREHLRVWLVNVTQMDWLAPKYALYELGLDSRTEPPR